MEGSGAGATDGPAGGEMEEEEEGRGGEGWETFIAGGAAEGVAALYRPSAVS